MPKNLLDKIREALKALLPITIVILILNFTVVPMPFEIRGLFIAGAVLLIAGLGLFILGADLALIPMGQHMGQYLSKSRKPLLIIISIFVLGTVITFAEPDFEIFINHITGISNRMMMLTIAAGVGIFLVIAILRIFFKWPLKYVLSILYATVFILAIFIPHDYIASAFDASGISTGPLTVPFIMAFGLGISQVRGGKSSGYDSFGYVALACVGTIIVSMLLTMINRDQYSVTTHMLDPAELDNIREITGYFTDRLVDYGREMAFAIIPIVIFFLIFQVLAIKLPPSQMIKMLVGSIYTFAGLVLFLTGVNAGFLQAGLFIGKYMGSIDLSFLLIPAGIIIGYFVVLAEPAVHVLVDQIEDLTGGAISRKLMLRSLSASVALAMGLAMLRVYLDIGILWILLPGYILALGLSFKVPKIFTAIAFDSGGAASGPVATAFLLPIAMGASYAMNGEIFSDALGTIAIIAMAPAFTVQTVGLIYKIKVTDTTNDEWGTIRDIANEIEEKGFLDWGEPVPSSDVYDDYKDVDIENMEFVASPEWAEIIHDENIWDEITTDDSYIDFDEIEMKYRKNCDDAPTVSG